MSLELLRQKDEFILRDGDVRVRVDFDALLARVRRGGRELITRAVGTKAGLQVIDCTAGLGGDSFILAAKGCSVTMVERSSSLFLMLEAALNNARTVPDLRPIVSRLHLVRGDARQVLSQLPAGQVDVVYIDPMFPPRQKTALVRGEIQLLQRLLGHDEDVQGLIEMGRRVASQRVVVKRPRRGGEPTGLMPTGEVIGRASRFEIYAPTA